MERETTKFNKQQEALRQQIITDYKMSVRSASPETWNAFVQAMIPLYIAEESKPELLNKVEFVKSILEDVAIGEKVGLITHHPTDLVTLGERLSELPPVWRIVSIACPDYHWNRVNGVMVPDIGNLNFGVPRTSEPLLRHLTTLSERAKHYGEKLDLSIIFAAWEFTASDYLPRINGGISSEAALSLLKKSQQATEERLKLLANGNFTYSTSLESPLDFHKNAQILTQEILQREGRKVSAIYEVRKHFYPEGRSQAALDLAISRQGFELAKQRGNILAVPTSATIARACLSGTGTAWIQYKPDYLG